MKKVLLFVAMLLLLVMAACGQKAETTATTEPEAPETEAANEEPEVEEATEVTVTHLKGDTVVSKNPEKVVVFDMGILGTLDKMGVEIAGLPQSNIPVHLEQYKDGKYLNAGSLFEPDFEALANLEPDLIIISGRQQDLYEEFEKLGPTIYLAGDNSNYLESFKSNTRVLGEIFGQEEFVETELAAIDAAIAELNEKAAKVENTLVILTNEGNISAYGPGSRFGLIHDLFGFTPVDENIEVSNHGMNVTYEYIVEKDPEYLFVVDRNAVVVGQSSAQSLENELTEKIKAYQEGKIVYLNPEFWYVAGPGLISVNEMIKEIGAALK